MKDTKIQVFEAEVIDFFVEEESIETMVILRSIDANQVFPSNEETFTTMVKNIKDVEQVTPQV